MTASSDLQVARSKCLSKPHAAYDEINVPLPLGTACILQIMDEPHPTVKLSFRMMQLCFLKARGSTPEFHLGVATVT
jgi:hypothetical protein